MPAPTCYGVPTLARNRVQILEINSEHPEPHRVRQAAARLESGQNVVYPTDTIYGLAAAVNQRGAVDRLYRLRKLDRSKPLSLVCANLSAVAHYAVVDNECFRAMKRVLPGPYTFILRATKAAPRLSQSKRKTVGIRVPSHPVAQALVEALGAPLLSTSGLGDPGGDLSDPVALAEVYAGTEVSLVLDAGLLRGVPSTVVDWSGDEPEILREGAGDVEALSP
jgi:tRNA threonylcarbamoyl adenosine modification protein (Sua5/YciO/YrdC/YwlC family)